MLARTTACMLEGVTRMVLEDVADQALAEMHAPPPVSDSAAAGGIVSGDAKSAAKSDPQYDWGAYYRRLEQQQQQLAQPQPSSRVAVVAACVAGDARLSHLRRADKSFFEDCVGRRTMRGLQGDHYVLVYG